MTAVSKTSWRLSLAAVAAVALAGLAGCNETAPPAAPPAPPPVAYQPPPPPPQLLGAPPVEAAPAPAREFITMAPIPNPEDMPPAERRRVYGDRFWTNHRYIAGIIRAKHAAHHAAWHAASAPAPRPILPKPVLSKPVAAATPAPAPAPVVAAPTPSPTDQLATAMNGKSKAVLAVPADLSAAKPGPVTLSLPGDLFAGIRDEAAKLGLGRAAKKAEVTATLHGDGYTITPPGPQTAPLTPGKPTSFTWQVTPGPAAKGPLTADVNAALKGAGDAKTFALAQLKQAVAAVDAAAAQAQAAHNFKLPSLDMLSIPGHKTVTLPVVGKTPSKHIVGAIIVLVALFLLAMAARSGSARREAENRQRRYRTMSTVMSAAAPEETVTPLPPVHEPQVEPVYAEAAAPVAVEALATSEGHGDHPAPDASRGHEAEAHAGEHGTGEHGEGDTHGHPSFNGIPYGIPGVTPSLEPRGPVVEHIVHEEPFAHAEPVTHEEPAVGYPIAVESHDAAETHAEPVAESVLATPDHVAAEAHADDHGQAAGHDDRPIHVEGRGLVLESV